VLVKEKGLSGRSLTLGVCDIAGCSPLQTVPTRARSSRLVRSSLQWIATAVLSGKGIVISLTLDPIVSSSNLRSDLDPSRA